MAKSGRLELGDSIYGHYRFIFNHCDIIGLQSNRIRWKKRKIKAYAVQGHQGRYQSKARMRLPISDNKNSNWHTISYRFGIIAAYCSNFGYFAFLILGDNVRCSSWAYWKARSGLPISVNWTLSLGVTAEALRAKSENRSKSAISLQRGQFDPIHAEGDIPTN